VEISKLRDNILNFFNKLNILTAFVLKMVESRKVKSIAEKAKRVDIWFLALFYSIILAKKLVENVIPDGNWIVFWSIILSVLFTILHYNKTLWLLCGYILLFAVRPTSGYDFTFNAGLLILLFLTAVRLVEIHEMRTVKYI